MYNLTGLAGVPVVGYPRFYPRGRRSHAPGSIARRVGPDPPPLAVDWSTGKRAVKTAAVTPAVRQVHRLIRALFDVAPPW
jgi:hypothetical protein